MATWFRAGFALEYFKLSHKQKKIGDKSNIKALNSYRFYHSHHACLRSIFMLHNETMNIWSHLLGFIFMTCLSIYGFNVKDYFFFQIHIFYQYQHIFSIEPFSRCIIQWPDYIHHILYSSFEMSVLFVHLPYFYLSLASPGEIIHGDIRLYGYIVSDHCLRVSPWILRLLLSTHDAFLLYALHNGNWKHWRICSVLGKMGHKGTSSASNCSICIDGRFKCCSCFPFSLFEWPESNLAFLWNSRPQRAHVYSRCYCL